MSHPVFHQGALPVAPSAIAGGPAAERYDGVHAFTRPRALRLPELAGIAGQFRAAAERGLAAGFDGVEVHAANGYLLDQSCATAPRFRRNAALALRQRSTFYSGAAGRYTDYPALDQSRRA